MDFKVRALDFISIFVKQKGYANSAKEGQQLHLIQGLLKGLTTAHKDKHTILFDRIKTVLAMMAKQNSKAEEHKADAGNEKSRECSVIITEMVAMLMRSSKDPQLLKAYSECLILMSKHFYEDVKNHEFLTFTFKQLLKKFLGGRCA